MPALSTTESRSRLWLLLATRYEAHAASAPTEAERQRWLARADKARLTSQAV